MQNNEIVFDSFDNCMAVAKAILDERSYVVMLSREETFFVMNFLCSDGSDRNDVVFMEKEDLWDKYVEKVDESDS